MTGGEFLAFRADRDIPGLLLRGSGCAADPIGGRLRERGARQEPHTREQRNRVLEAQRMAPSPPSALFLGKALSNLIFVAIVELFGLLAFASIFIVK